MKKLFKYLLGAIVLLVAAGLIFLFRPIASAPIATKSDEPVVDAVLIGGGIMSATLGTYLTELEPTWKINMYERLEQVAQESSNGWNNAGTGHSGFMEMNYTPEKDGHVEVTKAAAITQQFEVAKQFWSYQVGQGRLSHPREFINPVPHIAFVWDNDVDFLSKRYQAMIKNPMFEGMYYSENPEEIKTWAPLIIEGRDAKQRVAATRMDIGADVNYGEITRQLVAGLQQSENFSLQVNTEVTAISRNADNTWTVGFKNLKTGAQEHVKTRFVFIGAGGAAIKLLQYTGLPEANQYAGFPVGGQFLVSNNPEVVKRHTVKVYGKAAVGAPPMSVPHIDTRYLDGEKYVLFGPFATYSNKFLKNGSQADLLNATNKNNVLPMLAVGTENLDLVKYLISQVMLDDQDRFAELQEYYPDAKKEDWRLVTAGQRVQIIKKPEDGPATLQFGTEIFSAPDGSVTALLGASPGASTSPYIMLKLLEKAFPEQTKNQWNPKLHEIIQSYGQDLEQNPELLDQVRSYTSGQLGLNYTSHKAPTAVPEQAAEHMEQTLESAPAAN